MCAVRVFPLLNVGCLVLLGLLAGPATFASIPEKILALNGDKPYLVLLPANEAEKTAPELGIYVYNRDGSTRQIFSGELLNHRTHGAIQGQLEISNLDRRYEMLAILDGKLVLFHINSDQNDPKSFVRFGSPEHPVVDMLTNRPVRVPDLESAEDLTFRFLPPNVIAGAVASQAILVSMKLKHPSPHGDGITFVAYVSASESDVDKKLVLRGPIRALDFQFHSFEQLGSLIYTQPAGAQYRDKVISPMWAWSLTESRPDDPVAVKAWKEKLSERLAELGVEEVDKETKTSLASLLPYLDLTTGRRVIPQEPQEMLVLKAGTIVEQNYDLIAGGNRLVLREPRGIFKVELPGRLDIDSQNRYRIFNKANTPEALFFLEGELFLGKLDNPPAFLKLWDRKHYRESVKRLSYFIMSDTANSYGSGANLKYLLLSSSEQAAEPGAENVGGKGRTELLVYDERPGQPLRLLRTQLVSNNFYTDEQLAERVQSFDGHKMFDAMTPPNVEGVDYNKIYNKDGLHFDLEASTPDHVFFRFRGAYQRNGVSVAVENNRIALELAPETGAPLRTMLSISRLIPAAADKIQSLAYHVFKTPAREHGPGAENYHIFFSWKGPEGERTFVLVYRKSKRPDGKDWKFELVNNGEVPLVDRYIPEEDLARRVYTTDDGSVLFDDRTPTMGSDQEYSSKYDKTGVHIDITQTMVQGTGAIPDQALAHLVRRLREPVEQHNFGNGMSFRVFANGGKIVRPSGLFARQSYYNEHDLLENRTTPVIIAEPLRFKATENENEAGIFPVVSTQVNLPKETSHLTLTLSAMDQSFQGGEKGFQFLVTACHAAGYVDPAAGMETFSTTPFSMIRSFTLVPVRNENPDAFYVVFSTKDVPDPTGKPKPLKRGQTFLLRYKYEISQGNSNKNEVGRIVLTKAPATELLINESLSQEELVSRFVADTKGGAHFILTPELNQADLAFEVKALADGAIGRPNSATQNSDFKLEPRDKNLKGQPGQEWRIYSKNSDRDEIKALQDADLSIYQQEMFPAVTELLAKLTAPKAERKHYILEVDKALKQYVMNLMLARYIDSRPHSGWNHRDLALYLFQNDENKTQDDFFRNLEGIRNVAKKGPAVLIADMAEVWKNIYPRGGSVNFTHPSFVSQVGEADESQGPLGGGATGLTQVEVSPSSLYLLSTEGNKTPLEKAEESFRKLNIPEVLIGTKEEVQVLENLNVEVPFGLLRHFERVKLDVPPVSVRIAELKKVLERQEISSLGIKVATHSEDEKQDEALEYLVQKAERLAINEKQDPFSAFLKVKDAFIKALIFDDEVKKTRLIDRSFIDRMLAGIFSVPLNLGILGENDILRRISSPDGKPSTKALISWQKAGYIGSFPLKFEVLKTILSQLRKDPVMEVPSSIMLLGNSRTGKTFLFESLFKMLGLQLYKFNLSAKNLAENDEAQAFIFPSGKILDDNGKKAGRPGQDDNGDDMMSLDLAMAHLDCFLTLKNGGRGFIVFDDVHVLSDEMRAAVLKRVRSLLEGKYYKAKIIQGDTVKVVERPSRNLTIGMTFNPTQDIERIRKYVPNYSPWSPEPVKPIDLAKATLNSKNYQLEDSFFTRWNTIENLNKFPADAKGPTLVDSVTKSARDVLETANALIVVSTQAVRWIADTFRELNAKAFLSPATNELIDLGEAGLSHKSGFAIIVPKRKLNVELHGHVVAFDSKNDATTMPEFIQNSLEVVPVDGEYPGRLALLKVMSDSFRTHLYEALIEELSQNPGFAGDLQLQTTYLAPALRALGRHLLEREYLPLKEFNLDPYSFGAAQAVEVVKFRRALEAATDGETGKYFPVELDGGAPLDGLFAVLSDHTKSLKYERTHQHVFKETVDQLVSVLHEELLAKLYLGDLAKPPQPLEWARSLSAKKPEGYARAGEKLAVILKNFFEKVQEEALFRGDNADISISSYDTVGLFAYAMDKALTKLSWAEASGFTATAINALTNDVGVAQSQGVQNFLFEDAGSVVRPVTKDLVMQMVLGSPTAKLLDDEVAGKMHKRFVSLCEKFLRKAVK